MREFCPKGASLIRFAALTAVAWTLLCVGALASQCPSSSESVSVRLGFHTGETLVNAGDAYLESYVAGYSDAMIAGVLLHAPEGCVTLAFECLSDRSTAQLVAMLRKYLNDHPERWNHPGNVLTWNAIIAPCFAD